MSYGFYLMHRGWMDASVFEGQAYGERDAWCYLIEHAGYVPSKMRHNYNMVTVGRGQVPTSYRKLAEKFKWSVNRVTRFLSLLEKEQMISRKTDTGFLIITICNYDKYQNTPKITDTGSDTHPDTGSDTRSDTNIKKENKDNKNIHDTRTDFQKIYETGCALFPDLTTANPSFIHSWLNSGCSAELDCIPEIKRHAGNDISGWKYFSKAIMRAKATRITPLAEEKPHGTFNGTKGPTKDDRARAAVMRAAQAGGYAPEAGLGRPATAGAPPVSGIPSNENLRQGAGKP